ncbi:MAG: TonB-dependent receptor [Steroidobacteraceae bacterium]|nr:TonB-dependent receptor [Steroidobacteraceae bacterium]
MFRRLVPAAAPIVCVLAAIAASESAAEPVAEAASEAKLEEIVVTAQKRAETLQRTPAAVTALSGEALVAAGVTDIRAAQNLVPSVRFQMQNSSTEIYIRGVGSTLDLPNIEPPTVFNFNGVYIPREGTSVGLFDIASIEVLPGPQGSLYGRAALGGAVNVQFRRPAPEPETEALLEVGDYSLVHATVAQSLPVSDRFSLRAAADYIKHDGYLRTGADSKDDYALRLSGLYEDGERVSAYFWAHGAKKNGRSPNLVRRGYNGGTFDGDPNAFDSSDPWNDVITPTEPDAGRQEYENLVLGGQVDFRLGGATLTWIPSYFYLDWAGDYWLENLPSFLSSHYNQVTQELRLAGASGRWTWLGGLYAYRVTNDGEFIVNGFPLADIDRNRLEGVAGFGEATHALADRWRLTLGGRLSYDRREGDGVTAFGVPYDADQTFDRLDWKLGVEFDAAPQTLLYATVQTGYQPGTYNLFPSAPGQSNEVREAEMTAWSAGVKSRFLEGRLQLNNELFYYDYRDLLVQSFNLNTALLTTFNAEKVETWGNQLDLQWLVTDRGRLNLSVGYLHARYEDFVVPPEINIGPGTRDFGGYQLQYAPDWTVSAGYQHDFPVAGGYLRGRVESRYESAFWGTFNHSRGTQQQAYTKTDASLTYFAGDGRWSLGLWVKNIEDEAVLAATTTGQFGPYADAFLEPPRTWGARFTLSL